jgi:hypothetical protein
MKLKFIGKIALIALILIHIILVSFFHPSFYPAKARTANNKIKQAATKVSHSIKAKDTTQSPSLKDSILSN